MTFAVALARWSLIRSTPCWSTVSTRCAPPAWRRTRPIIDYVDAQTERSLAAVKRYANASGQPQEPRHDVILQHYLNHQAHHRGQVHDMLSQTTVAPPPLDMIYFVREAPDAA